MRLDLTDMLFSLSYALDKVEAELLGVDTGHGKRVALIALLMGKEAGFEGEELRDFVGCCILHDNALTEFIHEELLKSPASKELELRELGILRKETMTNFHSVLGEQNIRLLPFRTDVKNMVLYHHENADGSGAMGKTSNETGLKSQILHLADEADLTGRLVTATEEEFRDFMVWVQNQSGRMFSEAAVELFQKAVTMEALRYLKEGKVAAYLRQELPTEICEYSDEEIHNIAGMFAKIVDYKSEFTQFHSLGVASKAEQMAHYYGFDSEKVIRYYLAGALHDIGKLIVSNDILEKPDKLSADEFATMKNHASATYYILSQIKEIPDIIKWASNHHERLNGSGYPWGLTAGELSFEERLMACIDIYQALTEQRPYREGMSHEKAISILSDMVDRGEIDGRIVRDIDIVMRKQ